MPHAKSHQKSSERRRVDLRDVARRLDALERRVAGAARVGQSDPAAELSEITRRWDILEEDRLRRAIARDTAVRRDEPERWRQLEANRLRRNREQVAVNQQLRAAGCRALPPEPSLDQRLKALRKLEAHNRAETATSARRR